MSYSSTASGKDPVHTLSLTSIAGFLAFSQFPFKSARTRRRESPGISPSTARALHPPPCPLNCEIWAHVGHPSIAMSSRALEPEGPEGQEETDHPQQVGKTHSAGHRSRLFRQRICCLTFQTGLGSQNHQDWKGPVESTKSNINSALPSPLGSGCGSESQC